MLTRGARDDSWAAEGVIMQGHHFWREGESPEGLLTWAMTHGVVRMSHNARLLIIILLIYDKYMLSKMQQIWQFVSDVNSEYVSGILLSLTVLMIVIRYYLICR